MEYRIIDASVKHVDALEALEECCFSVPWTREQLISQLPDDRHVFLVAEDGEKLLGYIGMMYVLDEGYISNVAVAPDNRQRGIGSALISTLLQRAEALGISFVTLEVRESNTPAVRLYTKYGFSEVGLRKNYYDLPKENAILMTHFFEKRQEN